MCLLVGVLPVTERNRLFDALLEHLYARLFVEVFEYCSVVVRTYIECMGRKIGPLCGSCTVALFQNGDEVGVKLLAGDNQNILVVLCSSPDEGDAADIYFFDDLLVWLPGGDILLKRVEVCDDQVNLRDTVLCKLGLVQRVVPARKDASEYFWMQCLDPPSKYRGVGGDIFHRRDRNSKVTDKIAGTPGRENLCSGVVEQMCYFVNSILVVNRNKCSFDLSLFHIL
ncbi:hypothetical protein SDC9_138125 [bioreactor metagenome]|uniref:Uncharacterized protein n=1 Tax=bioreactor metagenome TaxID=1076179 RepID=A0A645DNG6_9ZZZZ